MHNSVAGTLTGIGCNIVLRPRGCTELENAKQQRAEHSAGNCKLDHAASAVADAELSRIPEQREAGFCH
jgi:hypothetical protein